MKRFLLAATLLGATFYTNAYAQFTGGSAGRAPVTTPTTTTKVISDRGVFDNAFYIRVGQSAPSGIFGELPTNEKPGRDNFNGVYGSGAQKGFIAEMGLISYFRDLSLAEPFRLGLDVNLALGSNEIDWTGAVADYDNSDLTPMTFAGLKIGPVFSYNPVGKLIFDAFFKLNPGISTAPEVAYFETQANGNYYGYALSNDYVPVFALRKSIGLNVRYSAFMLGMEYNFGKVKYMLDETIYSEVNGIPHSDNDSFEVETPISLLMLTGGFKF